MCEYQETIENSIPYCSYLHDACTYCVLGNCKTFNEATRSEQTYYESIGDTK